ncbi:hypothetical protein CCHR01_11485 [Colletotrichum chrysophilum]|uniref:Uncharacterized protein n=1 Tax=Colletotrichum chrysophilum TaxID=1836956 RepID=A0AAD9AF73_9PEZI|nr:hypothetical protein CCHR01_11485 [Colletotrichum chrysophilum]
MLELRITNHVLRPGLSSEKTSNMFRNRESNSGLCLTSQVHERASCWPLHHIGVDDVGLLRDLA